MAGPNPTFAQIWTQAGDVMEVVDEVYLFGNANTPNLLTLIDTATNSIDGEYTPSTLLGLDDLRSAIGAVLDPAFLRRLWRPFLLEFARLGDLESINSGDREILYDLRQAMIDGPAWVGGAAQTLNDMEMTLDTTFTSAGTGNGTAYRTTLDKDGHVLAAGGEVKTLTCDQDAASGTQRHEEAFLFSGTPRGSDGLQWEGSGLRNVPLTVLNAASAGIVRNSSWDTHDQTSSGSAPGSTTAITNWTVTTAANFLLYSTAAYVYRDYPGAPSTDWGVEFVADDALVQVVGTANPGASFDPDTPYHCSVRWQRKSSATGNITLHLGASTATTTIGSGSNDAWNILAIASGADQYFENFNETDLDIKVVVDTLATGTVVVDDLVLAPMTNIDGTFYCLLGGSTPWLRGATETVTDAAGATRGFAYWLWRAYGSDGRLPVTTGGTETVADF